MFFLIETSYKLIYDISFFVIAYLFYLFLQNSDFKNKTTEKLLVSRNNELYKLICKIMLKTRSIQISLGIAMLFKFTMFFLLHQGNKKVSGMFVGNLHYLLITSAILFTYVFNNLWGYLRCLNELILMRNSFYFMFKCYLISISNFIFFDFLVSIILVYVLKIKILLFLFIYLSALISNILIGIWASLFSMIEVSKALDFVNFKSNTSLGYNLVTFLSTSVICYLALTADSIFLYIITFILIALFFYFSISKIKVKYEESLFNN